MSRTGEPPAGSIRPALSTTDATMVVVSLVIGIGIFRTPAVVAEAARDPRLFLAAWTVGGLLSLAGALTFAEIGARYPRPGGYYRVVATCFHPAAAFALNWSQAILQGAGAAGVAYLGVEYLLPLVLPARLAGPRAVQVAAIALMALLLGLNALGVRTGARTQNLLSAAKIAMIVALAVAGMTLAPPAGGAAAPPAAPWSALLAALVPVFYAYGGYQNTMNLGGDVREASRNLPRAIVGGVALVTALYLAINIAYLHVLGIEGVAAEKLVAAAVARAAFGEVGARAVSVAIFLSAAGFVNATILSVPRSYLAMAEDGALPASFRAVDPRTQVQGAGLAFFAATMLVPALFLGSFEKLLSYIIFSDSLMLITVAATLFVLRRRGIGESSRFRVPGYPALPIAFVLTLVAVAVRLVVAETALALAGALVLAAGWPLFLLLRRLAARPPRPAGRAS